MHPQQASDSAPTDQQLEAASPFNWKDFAEAAGAILNVMMKIALAVAVAIIIFAPQWVPILKRFSFKSSEINILGSKIEIVDLALAGDAIKLTDDGKMLIAGLDASEIPDRIAKLEQTGNDLKTENDGLKSSVKELQALLEKTKKELDEASRRLPVSNDAPLGAGGLAGQIETTTSRATEQVQSADAVAAAAALVIEQPQAVPGVGFGIVFGGDRTPEAAMSEVRKAQRKIDNPIILYNRQGSWRSVAYFGTNTAATAALPSIKDIRADAYIVDISKWCPSPVRLSAETPEMVEQKDCGF